jgi:hypothetical protein
LNAPAGCIWNFSAEEGFAPFTEFGAFGNESETTKVHVRAADDDNESFPGSDKVVVMNISF